jgi:hypothetical protein
MLRNFRVSLSGDTLQQSAATIKMLITIITAMQIGLAVFSNLVEPPRNNIFHISRGNVQLLLAGAALLALIITATLWTSRGSSLLDALLRRLQRSVVSIVLMISALIGLAGAFRILPIVLWDGYVLLGLEVLLAAGVLYAAAYPTFPWRDRLSAITPIASLLMIVVGIGLRLWFMQVGEDADEGFYISLMIGGLQGMGTPPFWVFPPEVTHHPGWGRLMQLTYAGWAHLFGAGLMQARALNVFTGLLALLPIYAAVRLWYGQRSALISTSLIAISFMGVQSGMARNNGLPLLASGLAVWAHVALRRQDRHWLHVIVGLLCGVAMETHILNTSLLVAFGGVYGLEYLSEVQRTKRLLNASPLWFFLIGAGLSLAEYYYIHVATLPSPEGYVTYMANFGRPSLYAETIGRLEEAVLRYHALWSYSPAEFILLVLSVIAALIRRTEIDRHWLRLLLFNELSMLVFHPQGILLTAYTAYSMPILFAGVGPLILYGLNREERPMSAWLQFAYAGTAVALITYTVAFIELSRQQEGVQRALYQPVTDTLRAQVPEGETVIGMAGQIPYLMGYNVIMTPTLVEARLPADLIGMPREEYWLNVFLDLWPAAMLNQHFLLDEPPLSPTSQEGSYFLARGSTRAYQGLWIVEDAPLVTLPSDRRNEAPLQLVAYTPLDDGTIMLLFVTRDTLPEDLSVNLVLIDAAGNEADVAAAPLIDDVNALPTSLWRAYRFYAVTLTTTAPPIFDAHSFTLRATILGDKSLCAPDCIFEGTSDGSQGEP